MPKKILFLIDSLKTIGGAEQMYIDQANYFAKQGIEVHFASCVPSKIQDRFAHALDERVAYVGFVFSGLLDVSSYRQLVAYMRKHQIKVLYSYLDFSNNVARIAKLFSPSMRVVIVEPGDPFRKTRGMRVFDWFANFFVYKIFAMSDGIAERLVSYLGVHRKKILGMRNGVHPMLTAQEVAEKLESPPRSPFVLFHVGNMKTENKGHFGMLRAVSEVRRRRPDISPRFVLAGEGFMRKDFEEFARTQGISDVVEFTGAVPHEEIKKYYRAADVFMFNSRTEGGAASIMEATSAALPTVTSDFGSVREVVKDGKTGFVVPRDGVEEFAKAIIMLHDNAALRKSMSAEARKLYEERFTYDALADRFLKELFEA